MTRYSDALLRAAKALGVDPEDVLRAKRIKYHEPELAAAVKRGRMTLDAAERVMRHKRGLHAMTPYQWFAWVDSSTTLEERLERVAAYEIVVPERDQLRWAKEQEALRSALYEHLDKALDAFCKALGADVDDDEEAS